MEESNRLRDVARCNLFTAVRYVLVVLIVVNHCFILSGRESVWPLDSGTCVGCFFVISGYWATYSYVRMGDAVGFYCRRALRIFPEYWFAVLLCLLIGAAATSLPATDFFRSVHTWKYLAANLLTLNALCPTLPGVFDGNPVQAMNGSLWFVKIVVAFYLVVPLIARRGRVVAGNGLLLFLYLFAFAYLFAVERFLPESCSWLAHQFPGVMMYFVAGMCALKFFPWLIGHKCAAFAAGLLLLLAEAAAKSLLPEGCLWAEMAGLFRPVALALLLFAVAYSSEAVAKRLRWLRDYSYGLFLFHFPLCQIAVSAGLSEHYFWLCAFAVVTVSLLLSAAFGRLNRC